MPFQFTCPYCFKKTLVDNSYAGQAGPCATCGKTVTLPTPKELSPAVSQRSSSNLFVAGQATPARTNEEANLTIEPSLYSPFTSSTPPPPVITAPVTSDSGLLKKRQKRKYMVIGAGTVSVIVFGFITYNLVAALFSSTLFQDLQDRRNRTLCMNNLSKIALALNTYAATHGSYPPAVVFDDKGKPKHSWRVLILRELGEIALYNQYRFDEPWDSEHNSLLFPQCPTVFTSPGPGKSRENHYFLVVGGNTLFPNGAPMKPQDISDGPGRTILVVEAQNSIHEWTKPIDVAHGGNSAIKMGGNHQGGFNAAAADGTPLWIPDDTAPVLIDSLISPTGNESVDASVFRP